MFFRHVNQTSFLFDDQEEEEKEHEKKVRKRRGSRARERVEGPVDLHKEFGFGWFFRGILVIIVDA